MQENTSGISWGDGETAGRSIPITDFFIAKPGDSVKDINSALARGQHLILTPGVYDIAQTIEVKRADTVVLGIGHATLTAVGGAVPLEIKDAAGIVVAGVTIDAGTELSPVLLRVGKAGSDYPVPAANPITLSDVYFRVGGPHIGKATTALEINSDNVLIDHTWVWRGDHGVEGFTDAERRHRALEHQHRNQRRHRQRRQRHGDRPVRRALPAVQHALERRERPRHPVPERAAVRPAHPGGLDAARRHARLPRLRGRR